jgi:hypothetical protein
MRYNNRTGRWFCTNLLYVHYTIQKRLYRESEDDEEEEVGSYFIINESDYSGNQCTNHMEK